MGNGITTSGPDPHCLKIIKNRLVVVAKSRQHPATSAIHYVQLYIAANSRRSISAKTLISGATLARPIDVLVRSLRTNAHQPVTGW
jgi:hypothetical protein